MVFTHLSTNIQNTCLQYTKSNASQLSMKKRRRRKAIIVIITRSCSIRIAQIMAKLLSITKVLDGPLANHFTSASMQLVSLILFSDLTDVVSQPFSSSSPLSAFCCKRVNDNLVGRNFKSMIWSYLSFPSICQLIISCT